MDAHREKYFWLKNSYDHAENLQVSFFEERRKSLDVDLNKKYVKRTLMVKKQKTELENKYQIPKDVLHIASRILDAMEFQDDRKKEILITIHYKDLFLQEFRKRGITHPERYALNELSMILDGKHQENRLEDTGFILKDGVLHEINSQASIRYWDLYANEKTSNEVREFRGTVASKGEVLRGVVRVILDPESPSAQQFQYGEILVSPMTSPEYVFLMKKSAAIVTDTGGLTSHAAIVSRELGVPCIVGTKIATQVLQNRDLVEVDANAGIVRILERGESTQS